MSTAQDIYDVISRYRDFVEGVSPFKASSEDTTEDLKELHVLIKGWSAPKDEVPDRGIVGLLSDLCVDIDAELHARMEHDKVQLGEYEVERTPQRYDDTWDDVGAATEISIAAVLGEGGEVPESPIEAANTAVNAILKCAGIYYWRMGEAKKLGVDLGKFRDRGVRTSPHGVIVRKRQEAIPPAPVHNHPQSDLSDPQMGELIRPRRDPDA